MIPWAQRRSTQQAIHKGPWVAPVYATGGRPKSPDPTVPLTIRLPQSVWQKWEKRAKDEGVSVRELLQRLLIDRARKDTDG